MKKLLLLLFTTLISIHNNGIAMTQEMREKGFVYLHEIDPTILVDLRYNTDNNFIGERIPGYEADSSVAIVTRQAAEALKNAQAEFIKDGYSLVVYDAYRPQRAVDRFSRWSKDFADQKMKKQNYPRFDKALAFEQGYIMERSGHSRGSTVDVTLIKLGNKLHPVQEKERTLLDGFTITLLDDGTIDMGSSFDLCDVASHFINNVIEAKYHVMRTYLKNVMEKHGFAPYPEEWWHFTLKGEPFPADLDSSYFDFVIK